MTEQHRATPEQWAAQKAWAVAAPNSSCILELRDRLEALEAAQRPQEKESERGGKTNADSLYEKVAAVTDGDRRHARAAIREVAAWLRTFPEIRTTPKGVATTLDDELNM